MRSALENGELTAERLASYQRLKSEVRLLLERKRQQRQTEKHGAKERLDVDDENSKSRSGKRVENTDSGLG